MGGNQRRMQSGTTRPRLRAMLFSLVLMTLAAAEPLAQEEPAGESTAVVTTAAETKQEEKKEERRFTGLGVPLLSYNSDFGLGFGAVGGGYFYSPGYEPYRHAFSAQVFITTRGVQNHFLRYDGVNLIGKLRVEGKLEFRRELLAPYYGAETSPPSPSIRPRTSTIPSTISIASHPPPGCASDRIPSGRSIPSKPSGSTRSAMSR